MRVFIYCLKHPETQEIRYVGRTNNLTRRFKEHLRDSRAASSHKKAWIAQLLKSDLLPVIEILEECESSIAPERETYWILKFSNLVNDFRRDGTCGFIAGSVRQELRKTVVGRHLESGEEIILKGIYSSQEFSGNAISRCLRGVCKVHKGYGWKLLGESLFSHEKPFLRSAGFGVIRVDSVGNECYYSKVTDAEKEGFLSSGICRVASGASVSHKGFFWKWATQHDRERFTGKSDKFAFKRNKKRN